MQNVRGDQGTGLCCYLGRIQLTFAEVVSDQSILSCIVTHVHYLELLGAPPRVICVKFESSRYLCSRQKS